ncbi:MAG: hypothetical protein OXB88_06590 [Bacteriovoracales bacterium]|nr:hypothetical protein [Bacteriovoracales bacterium]
MRKNLKEINHNLVNITGKAPIVMKSLGRKKNEKKDLIALEKIATNILKLVGDYREVTELKNK